MESVGDVLRAIRDPRIAELGRRGQAAAAAAAVTVAVEEPEVVAPEDTERDEGAGGELAHASLRLVDPRRACIETNLTRRGFWLAVAGGPRQLALPLDGEDRFGVFTVTPGADGPLTVLEFEVITWLCSRWRELDDPKERRCHSASDNWKRTSGGADVAATSVVWHSRSIDCVTRPSPRRSGHH